MALDPGAEFVGDDPVASGIIYKPATMQTVGSPAALAGAGGSFDGSPSNGSPLAQSFVPLGPGGEMGDPFTLTVVDLIGRDATVPGDADMNDGAGEGAATRADGATAIAAWAGSAPTGSGVTNALVIGDFQSFPEEQAIANIEAGGFTDVSPGEIGADDYSRVIDGQAGRADYGFVNAAYAPRIEDAARWHINADEAPALDYRSGSGPAAAKDATSPARFGVADPLIVSLNAAFPPVANPDMLPVDEDATAAVLDVLMNDMAGSSPSFTVTGLDTTGTQGTPTITPGGGSVTYDTDGLFNALTATETAMTSFDYTITDGNGQASTATVTLAIDGMNDPVTAMPDFADADEDGPAITIDLTGNDTDVDTNDDPEIQSLDLTAPMGAVSVNPDNDTVEYDPTGMFDVLDDGELAVDSFDYTATDGNGSMSTATVLVTMTGEEDPVIAVDDVAGVGENGPAIVIDLTGNDIDLDGDDIEITGLTLAGTQGTVTLNADSDTVTYDPAGAFPPLIGGATAIDSFEYEVTDGNGNVDTGLVTVTVTGENSPPLPAPDSATVSEDGPPVTIDLLGNDTDFDADPITLQSLDTSGTTGTVTLNADGSVEYDPAGQFDALAMGETAIDSVTYQVAGAAGPTAATVTIEGVNDPPMAVDDSSAVNGEGPAVVVDVLANDSDVDATASLMIAGLDLGGTLGTATVTLDGKVIYDPNGAFGGLAPGEQASDSFTYDVTDGKATSTARVTIAVTGTPLSTDQNFAPVAANDQAMASVLTGLVLIDALDNDTDPNGDPLKISSITAPPRGGAVISGNGQGVFFDPLDDFPELGTGEAADVSFSYTISDGRGGSDSATVTVTVKGPGTGVVDLPPVARADAISGPASGPIGGDVLANNGFGADLDPEGGPLTVTALNGSAAAVGSTTVLASGASITLQASGLFSYDPSGAPAPGPGASLADSFVYTVEDGAGQPASATVTVTRTGPGVIVIESTPDDDDIVLMADEIVPGAGYAIDGGDGTDTLFLPFDAAEATIECRAGGHRISRPDGTVIDTTSIEAIAFDDVTLIADESPEALALNRLFETILDRKLDPGGARHYLGQIREDGRGLASIGDELAGGDEFAETFGMVEDDMVPEIMFENGLERMIDMEGNLNYDAALADGRLSRGGVGFEISDGPEARGIYADIAAILVVDEMMV